MGFWPWEWLGFLSDGEFRVPQGWATHGNSGSRDFPVLIRPPESPIRLTSRARWTGLCSVNLLNSCGPPELCTRTHHPEELLWLCQIRTPASVSLGNSCPLPNLASSSQTCPFASLVRGIFPAWGPWLAAAVAVWQNIQTYLSGDSDLDNSASFRRLHPLKVWLWCVLFLNRTFLSEASELLKHTH